MAYLRLIKDMMGNWCETLTSTLNIHVVIADRNLVRIVGTGAFTSRVNENCPEDSLFAEVIKTGRPRIGLTNEIDSVCINCSNHGNCSENMNMIYPIRNGEKIIGAISFAAIENNEVDQMIRKQDDYFNMLKYSVDIIEKEIQAVKSANQLKNNRTGIDELINLIDIGIIILDDENKIMNINIEALNILRINIRDEKVLDESIFNIMPDLSVYSMGEEKAYRKINHGKEEVSIEYTIEKINIEGKDGSHIINIREIKDSCLRAKDIDLIGQSPAFKDLIKKVDRLAKKSTNLLLTGESGTGKDLIARYVHRTSLRKGKFVVINCGAIPENLMESELFGYEKGAFTGANPKGKLGKLEEANGGTLFLDEIGDLALHLQTKLLRVIQEREYTRVGGLDSIPIDINVISATHRNLEKLVEENKFRLDLYYRLNGIKLNIPPLRDRGSDVILLASHFMEERSINKSLSREVEDLFLSYHWPGNIRELENVIQYIDVFSDENLIALEDLPLELMEAYKKRPDININMALEDITRQYERDLIENLIDEFGDSLEVKKDIAERLGISLTTLYRKLNI